MLLAVRESGPEGGPVAVLVHGVNASARTWWRVAPALAERGMRVLAVDQRGHGSSPRLEGPADAGELGEDLLETLDAHGAGHGVQLLWGHSLGAVAALEALRRRPRLAARAVLEDPPGSRSASYEAVADGIERDDAAVAAFPERWVAEVERQEPRWHPEDVRASAEGVRACDTAPVAASVRRGIGHDLAQLVGSLEVPALLLLAREDRGSPLTGDERGEVVDRLAAGEAVEMDGGHCLHRELFDETLARALAWLDGRAPAAA